MLSECEWLIQTRRPASLLSILIGRVTLAALAATHSCARAASSWERWGTGIVGALRIHERFFAIAIAIAIAIIGSLAAVIRGVATRWFIARCRCSCGGQSRR